MSIRQLIDLPESEPEVKDQTQKELTPLDAVEALKDPKVWKTIDKTDYHRVSIFFDRNHIIDRTNAFNELKQRWSEFDWTRDGNVVNVRNVVLLLQKHCRLTVGYLLSGKKLT